MPLLSEIGKVPRKTEAPLTFAHFTETHWVHPTKPWAAAAEGMAALLPRDARPERPRPWYHRLAGTHWPGQIPPGNGPFYIPEWVFEDEAEEERVTEALERAGFKPMTAHVLYLPQNAEQLVSVMRVAGKHPWTANPQTARGYIYPKLRRAPDKKLRDYNVQRWRV